MKTSETRPTGDWIARSLAIVAVVGSGLSFFWPSEPWDDPEAPSPAQASQAETAAQSVKTSASPPSADWNQLARQAHKITHRVGQSVVRIEVPSADATDRTSSRPTISVVPGNELSTQGSGLIVEPHGTIITNYHVVRESTRVDVQLEDGRRFPAQVLAVDASVDLAILKVEATELPAIQWADSDRVQTGDFVWAIGYPYGWRQSLTFGIISARPQVSGESSPLASLLQSDVAIHPGHSGSCWMNTEGQVIGVATTIVGKTFQGLSYAIPSNVVQQAMKKLQAERTGEN